MEVCRRMFVGYSLISTIILSQLSGTIADLQSYGCDIGWTDFENHCYKIQTGDLTADNAKLGCQSLGSSLSSIWSAEERAFIVSLWQFPTSDVGFLWFGMRGNSAGDWLFDDQSSVKIKRGNFHWSIFDDLPGMPAATPKKCVALRSTGSLAFLDCSMLGDAFVCKKALPKVFVTSKAANSTNQAPASKTGHNQLFERLLPPELISMPSESSRLAETPVETEIGCAFRCFSVTGCQVFKVSCDTRNNCDTFFCGLYTT
ncbi:hypothetical protein BsWGS_20138 [Bradybaena similaris]